METQDKKHIEELRLYIQDKYKGDIQLALESIGGLKLVRKILRLDDNLAVLDPKLYRLPE